MTINSQQQKVPLDELDDRVQAALNLFTLEDLRQLIAEIDDELGRSNVE